jgi:hypothetical protein
MGPSPLAGLLALKNVRFSILWDLLPLKTSLNLPIEFSEVGWTQFHKVAPDCGQALCVLFLIRYRRRLPSTE